MELKEYYDAIIEEAVELEKNALQERTKGELAGAAGALGGGFAGLGTTGLIARRMINKGGIESLMKSPAKTRLLALGPAAAGVAGGVGLAHLLGKKRK